jgi:hypothetical protein
MIPTIINAAIPPPPAATQTHGATPGDNRDEFVPWAELPNGECGRFGRTGLDANGALPKPRVEQLSKEERDGYLEVHVRVQVSPEDHVADGYLLVPPGDGPFPAVLVPFYEPLTRHCLKTDLS